jgi:UDP-N-acetyl-D-mannosaminuronate dehydrogenase
MFGNNVHNNFESSWLGGCVTSGRVVILGMGEIGRPLAQILSKSYQCYEVDIAPVEIKESCSVLHICYPFQIPDFVGMTLRYIQKYKPALVIINSTVAPGTTEAIYASSGCVPTAYSPVRGKHARMQQDMLHYKKFVGGCDPDSTAAALTHFAGAGFMTATFRSPRLGELSKLLETTYFGILIGWAQEVERIAHAQGGEFNDVNAFVEEIDFLPSHIFPGVIGGHCVMPNIAILQQQHPSSFLRAVVESNELKQEQSRKAGSRTNLCSTSV